MLSEEDYRTFTTLRIRAFGEKVREIAENAAYDNTPFEDLIKLALDAEVEARASRKVEKLVKGASFKDRSACLEEIIYLPERTLTKEQIARLGRCEWAISAENVVIVAKTACGKSYLCQALGNAACRKAIDVLYTRLADLCGELNRARAEGGCAYYEKMDSYKKVSVLILDDFLTTPIAAQNCVDLFEIVEAREGRASTIIATQLEPEEWYLRIEGEVMADSILSRIATRSRYVDIDGPNMREYMHKHSTAS